MEIVWSISIFQKMKAFVFAWGIVFQIRITILDVCVKMND